MPRSASSLASLRRSRTSVPRTASATASACATRIAVPPHIGERAWHGETNMNQGYWEEIMGWVDVAGGGDEQLHRLALKGFQQA